ncbi:MAG: hypothetical protein KF819_16795 [Labilithrix sp.]|nr:hypothetical protein [Labilithrix sp.]
MSTFARDGGSLDRGLSSARRATWLFSRNVDLGVFLGSALFSFAMLGVGALTGALDAETPAWAWVPAIVLCDVAHVWSTIFRTYLDPAERRARARLFTVAPAVGLAASVALYAVGDRAFWRALAYLAIFHFVRQQYGWVSLYRARAGETDGRFIDAAAIYASTLWPLLHWHTHLPRRFAWFIPGDIVALPSFVMPVATIAYVSALGAYAIRAATLWMRGAANPGKDVVVATTAVAWYVGIVAFDSDYAFTVTNVFMHGIPYFALVFVQSRARAAVRTQAPSIGERITKRVFLYLGVLWLIAFGEEMLWDRAVWHDRSWLFGEGWDVGALKLFIVPLLALPQLTHYVLDGFIWRRRANPAAFEPQVTASTSSP